MEFIQKIKTPELIEIKIKKVFEEKTSEFNGKVSRYTNCIVDYNGTDYYAKFTPKKYSIMQEGATINGVRRVIDGNPYFDWLAGGDGQTLPQEQAMEPPPPTQEYQETKPRDYDAENRGKIRTNLVKALIEYGGLFDINESIKKRLNTLVEYIMTGK
jgi:hypothetical protein